MSRYSKTERLGVIETDRIVTKNLDWIFREQPIIDVGLDALIEQSIEGEPQGRFLAVQIKTGIGNFHPSSDKLTYYVSHIHYNYWLNLDISIILIAHIPETEKTYWQIISEQTFKKTKKKWKIEIPKKQEFNENSKNRLTQILSDKNQDNLVFDLYRGKIESDSLFDFAENTNCIGDSGTCITNLTVSISDLDIRTKEFNKKLKDYANRGLSDKDPQVKASIKGFGKDINICSKRLESEVVLFTELYSEGIFAYEQVVLSHYLITKDKANLVFALDTLQGIPNSVDEALEGIQVMRNGISKLPNNYAVLKESKKVLLEIIDLIITEFGESKIMTKRLTEKIDLEI